MAGNDDQTANSHLDDAYADTRTEVKPGQYVLVAVSDTGIGMAPDVAARAFEPFFTTKPVGKGTGLGLSQVYGFAKQSGGHVAIYSEPGHGMTIKIYLPRLVGTAAGAVKEEHPTGELLPRARGHEIVLVVEDDPQLRELSVQMLEELGYRAINCAEAAEALAVLEAQPIALLLTDVVMPGMSGRQLAEAALTRRPELKVLFMTGYTRNAIIHNGVLDAGIELLVKPFTLEALARKLDRLLRQGSPNRS